MMSGLKIETARGIVRTLTAVLSQAVEDEHLSANPALSMRKHLRRGDDPEPVIDPFTRCAERRIATRIDVTQTSPGIS